MTDGGMAADLTRLLAECEACVGYRFQDKSLLLAALTHASGAKSRLGSNERMEFLGDAILGMVVCELLYHNYPDLLEGELTRIKSVVVSRVMCAKISRDLALQKYLLLGKGMISNSALPSSLLSDVFESLVAGIYLDGGMEPARQFIHRHMAARIPPIAAGDAGNNAKSELQHLSQRDFTKTPHYALLDESGPDHSKQFQVAARIGARQFAPAWGKSKKEAEQRAAWMALQELLEESGPLPD